MLTSIGFWYNPEEYNAMLQVCFQQIKADYGDIITVKWFDSKPTRNKLRFNGSIYVLAGKQNFSEESGVVCAVKDYNMVIIIGEKTGSAVNAFGYMFYYRLPNSNLEISISVKKIFAQVVIKQWTKV